MIEVGQTWVEQATGDEVVIDWISDELVSYLRVGAEKAVRTVRKFVFMQDFRSKGDE